MITIKKENDIITFKGHTDPDVCASVSSIMYTTVNAITRFDDKCLTFKDDTENDIVTVKINYYNALVDLLMDNMFDMLNDLQEQTDGKIEIKNTDY